MLKQIVIANEACKSQFQKNFMQNSEDKSLKHDHFKGKVMRNLKKKEKNGGGQNKY